MDMELFIPSKWDQRFLDLAYFISDWSKDPSTKVGAVITDRKNRIVSIGFNGLAQGLEDNYESLNNRDLKYKRIIHAERNAIIFAQRSVEDCVLYTVPFMCCAICASLMIQAGIKRVVAPYSDNPRWQEDFLIATQDFHTAGVELNLVHSKF